MKILGIDPGYERLGIAILERSGFAGVSRGGTASAGSYDMSKHQVVFSECFKTSAKLGFEDRLLLIGQEVRRVIKKYKPEVLAIETLFLTTNQKTVMRVAEARGVVIYEATGAGLRVFEASPLQVKVATTGYGKASKEQVMKMVKLLVDFDPVRGRRSPRSSSSSNGTDDELDAIAVALTAQAHLKL